MYINHVVKRAKNNEISKIVGEIEIRIETERERQYTFLTKVRK